MNPTLSPANLQALRTGILADPAGVVFLNAGDVPGLLGWLNGAATPPQAAWRVDVAGREVYAAHKPSEYIARTAAERAAFDLMVSNGPHDFTRAAMRNGVANIFSGTTNQTSRTGIFTAAQESATSAQVILGGAAASVGGSSDMAETVTALKRNFTGSVNSDEASQLIAGIFPAKTG